MDKKDCMFPELLKDRKPGQCSPEQQCVCHKKSGGEHPLPEEMKGKCGDEEGK